MKIELCNCNNVLLNEINTKVMKRNDIAKTYRLAMQSSERVDWETINLAIIKRWSRSALYYIKKLAWSEKCFKR